MIAQIKNIDATNHTKITVTLDIAIPQKPDDNRNEFYTEEEQSERMAKYHTTKSAIDQLRAGECGLVQGEYVCEV